MCALVGLEAVRDKAILRKQEAELLQLFSPYDSVILLCGITELTQAKAAEKLLADCLAIVYKIKMCRTGTPAGQRHFRKPMSNADDPRQQGGNARNVATSRSLLLAVVDTFYPEHFRWHGPPLLQLPRVLL